MTMSEVNDKTIVADIGARYGMHPSWNGFDAPLQYIAFEPDPEEAGRLRAAYENTAHFEYEVSETAFDKQQGLREFYLLRHRGLSSCLKPDLTSECFRHLKPGQAEIDKVLQIEMERADDWFETRGIVPDFLKVDTEGTEQDVMEGADRLYDKGVLGVRSSCNFQPCFIGQRLFSESHDYLLSKDFILLNLEYQGFGYPRLGLFRKPDPIVTENHRYGILVAADAIWIRNPDSLSEQFSGDRFAIAKLKLAGFCFFNEAPDLAIDLMRELSVDGHISDAVRNSRLYRVLRLKAARFLGRYRTVPDDQWEKAGSIYQTIFGEALCGGSEFYPQVNKMVRELQA